MHELCWWPCSLLKLVDDVSVLIPSVLTDSPAAALSQWAASEGSPGASGRGVCVSGSPPAALR